MGSNKVNLIGRLRIDYIVVRSDLEEAEIQRDHEDLVAPAATWLLLQFQSQIMPPAITDSHLVQQ